MEDSIVILASLLLTLLAVYIIVAPHFRKDLELNSQEELKEDLAARKSAEDRLERLGQILSDLELDLQTGKLSDEEYESMRARTEKEFNQVRSSLGV